MLVAEIIVYAAFIYLALGSLFAVYYVFAGVQKYDEDAKNAGIGFRLIIFFGVAALWVIFASRMLSGRKRPIEETAHRKIAEEIK